MFETPRVLGLTWKFSFYAIRGTKTLRVEGIGYRVKEHQEIHRDCKKTCRVGWHLDANTFIGAKNHVKLVVKIIIF
jgi:hypothetical protein